MRALSNFARGHQHELRVLYRRLRQRWFMLRVALLAKWEQASVSFDFAPDVQIGRDVRVIVWPGTHTSFVMGPKSRICDNVVLHLRGGSFQGGVRTDLRQNCTLQIGGDIVLDGENTISFGCTLHSGASIHIGYATIMGEYSTVADSTHFHTAPDDPVQDNAKYAPVEIGRNTFIGPRVSVGRGLAIGSWCIIGPNSVVARDIPHGVFASGIPAAVVRSLEHPWMHDVETAAPGAPDPAWPAQTKHQP